jgi:hypothetical protein
VCVSTSAAVYYTTVYWQKFSFEKIVIWVPSSSNKHGHSIRLLYIQKGTSHHHHHMVNKPLFHRLLTILRIGEKKYWTLKRKRERKKKHHREICRCVLGSSRSSAIFAILYNQPRWLDFSLVCAGAHTRFYIACVVVYRQEPHGPRPMGIYRKEEQVPPRFVSARRSDDSVAIASVLRVFLEKCWKFIIISIRTNERRRNYFSNFLSRKLCRQQINEEKRRWKKCWWRWREDVYLNSRQLFSAYQVLLRLSAQVFPSFFFLKKEI